MFSRFSQTFVTGVFGILPVALTFAVFATSCGRGLRMPIVDVEGDKVYVQHARNFTWRTATDFDPKFYDRVYDVSKINSRYYIVAPMPIWDGVAHVFVNFGFTDGQHCTVSA